ncbi:hypothetical protein OPW36_17355 [Vibrio europaeus]|uniref:DUF7683 domain-containing protein n=1 Tax=Vibrio europaeus TaxID=300876 RepID=A0AAE7AZN1_9VIBR|nr:hypothetical protein [Vibrio europaeus]MDC5805433.1 hypothetical protein [Vibrio europaeus]MDC5811261.1 hypothetical protein [Vibrio europaeus]MDC5826492.1 hypothetical protein [Vibrio europaeus]MDC5831858.1 hypothetical protein [Vibrio europaeus]MDC5834813.1 hypothetical protein [Vibrio europaeus]
MKVVIEAFDKKSELLLSEIELKSSHVDEVSKILGLSEDDLQFLLAGAGGFDISTEQVKAIEAIIGESFYSSQCDYQLGTS